jgi:hypothetical protein
MRPIFGRFQVSAFLSVFAGKGNDRIPPGMQKKSEQARCEINQLFHLEISRK